MNNDLISREALKEALKSNCKPEICHDYGTNWCEACCPHNDFEDLIDNAPTVDIKDQIAGAYNEGYACGGRESKRPQGEWLDIYSSHIAYECSNCHNQMPIITAYYHFCPNCGAQMRGDRK